MSNSPKELPSKIGLKEVTALTRMQFQKKQGDERRALIENPHNPFALPSSSVRSEPIEPTLVNHGHVDTENVLRLLSAIIASNANTERPVKNAANHPPKKSRAMMNRIRNVAASILFAITSSGFTIPAYSQEPNPTPISVPADSAPSETRIMLPIIERKDLTPEQISEQKFKELMHQVSGKDFFSGNPRFLFVENGEPFVNGKKEFIAVSNDFLKIATDLINEWNAITDQNDVSGYKQNYIHTPLIQYSFGTSDVSQGNILSYPDVSGTLQIEVKKGSIFAIARSIAELMVPKAAIYSDFGNSEAMRQIQVRALTIELASQYHTYFINELHPAVLLLYREDGSSYYPTKEEYLELFRQEMAKWQDPQSAISPIPTNVSLKEGVLYPKYSDDALSVSHRGSSPIAEQITDIYATKAYRVYRDAVNSWTAQGKNTGYPEFWIMSQLGFMQGEDQFGLMKDFTNALGVTEFLAFLRTKFSEAGFILPRDEFSRQAEEIKYSPQTEPLITNFYPTGDIGSLDGITVYTAIQLSNFEEGNLFSKLESFTQFENQQQHPIVEANYYVHSERTGASFWVHIPPLTPIKFGEGIFKYVFPRHFSFIDVDGQPTEIDLSGRTLYVELLMTQAEPNENGDRRNEKYQTITTFRTDNSSSENVEVPDAPDTNAVTVEMILLADSN